MDIRILDRRAVPKGDDATPARRFSAGKNAKIRRQVPEGDDAGWPYIIVVELTPGWHRVQLRSFAWGYGSARAGLAIDAPLEELWGISSSGKPPQAAR